MVRKDLVGIAGGVKQHMHRLLRDEIMAYCKQYGPEATMKEYNIARRQTLDRILSPPKTKTERFSKADKAIIRAEQAEITLRQVKAEVIGLRHDFGTFVEQVSTQLVDKFFTPLLQSNIKVNERLILKPGDDPLSMNDFDAKSSLENVKQIIKKSKHE